MKKSAFTQKVASMLAVIFLLVAITATSQTYFAGTNAGNGNTATTAVGIGPNALSVANSGPLNLGVGIGALNVNTTGNSNTVVGNFGMNFNKTGKANTGTGTYVLNRNVSGDSNTVNGYMSMYFSTTGHRNTATGVYSLYRNTSGYSNVANGYLSLRNNLTGYSNVAVGAASLRDNSSGFHNTAVGDSAMMKNTFGKENVAVGAYSLLTNLSGSYNTAVGNEAMKRLRVGDGNIAVGSGAMSDSDSTKNSVAVGVFSLWGGSSNCVAVGNNALGLGGGVIGNSVAIGNYAGYESGNSNVMVGNSAGATIECITNNVAIGNSAGRGNISIYYGKCVFLGHNSSFANSNIVRYDSNSTAIGYGAKVDASNKVVIGNTAVSSIGGWANWTNFSDRRLKTNINKSKLGLDFIMALNPVTYNYTVEGQKDILQTGLIAQDVEEAAKKAGVDFSGVDKSGEYWGIRYATLTVPLIKAMQEMEEKHTAELIAQQQTNTSLQQEIETLKTELKNLAALVGKNNTVKQDASVINNSGSVLFQNEPNPFSTATTIRYKIAEAGAKAALIIKDVTGNTVKQININSKGSGSVSLQASELPAGNYSCTLFVNNNIVDTKKILLLK